MLDTMTAPTRTDLLSDALIGRTAAGDRVYVTLTLSQRFGTYETVTHDTVTDPWQLTASGLIVGRRERNAYGAGQCLDILDRVTVPARPFTLSDVRTVASLWRRWHLNAMRAGCAHVSDRDVWERHVSVPIGTVCPVSGYRYGHAWLVEPLPADGTCTVNGDPMAVARFVAGRTPRPQTYSGR